MTEEMHSLQNESAIEDILDVCMILREEVLMLT